MLALLPIPFNLLFPHHAIPVLLSSASLLPHHFMPALLSSPHFFTSHHACSAFLYLTPSSSHHACSAFFCLTLSSSHHIFSAFLCLNLSLHCFCCLNSVCSISSMYASCSDIVISFHVFLILSLNSVQYIHGSQQLFNEAISPLPPNVKASEK